MRRLLVTLFVLAAAPAAAEPEDQPIVIAVNPPLRWADADAVGASGYIALTPHQALRGNVSRYDFVGNVAGDIFGLINGSDGDEGSHSGRISDTGVGWMYFPRRLWSGPTIEAGLLRRVRDTRSEDELGSPAILETATTTYAGRALVGWSWLIAGRGFISFQTGFSYGYERGTETSTKEIIDTMSFTHPVARSRVSGEAFLRLGVAFGR